MQYIASVRSALGRIMVARYTIVYTPDGRTFMKGSPEYEAYLGERYQYPAVFGDSEEFVSPIDGKLYSGRVAAREHNARHDVVNHRDLKGLPVGINPQGKAPVPSTRERQELRQAIAEAARSKGYLDGQ
jgi:hypothetical protein